MPSFDLSRLAEADLLEIAEFTERTWSERQSKEYLAKLERCCVMLASYPTLGRAFDPERPSLRRMERGSHVVLYRKSSNGILILRFLHKSMLARLHEI